VQLPLTRVVRIYITLFRAIALLASIHADSVCALVWVKPSPPCRSLLLELLINYFDIFRKAIEPQRFPLTVGLNRNPQRVSRLCERNGCRRSACSLAWFIHGLSDLRGFRWRCCGQGARRVTGESGRDQRDLLIPSRKATYSLRDSSGSQLRWPGFPRKNRKSRDRRNRSCAYGHGRSGRTLASGMRRSPQSAGLALFQGGWVQSMSCIEFPSLVSAQPHAPFCTSSGL